VKRAICVECGSDYVMRTNPHGDQRLGGVSTPTQEPVRCSNPNCPRHELARQNDFMVNITWKEA